MTEWEPRYLLGFYRRAKEVPELKAITRFLAADPWFVRSVCPGSDAITCNEAFVYPLVLQSVVVLRGVLRWPPPPMNDDSIERLCGVPQFGRALEAAGVCKRDEDGLYDLIPIDRILPARPVSHKGVKKQNRREGIARLKRLGHSGVVPANPLRHWITDTIKELTEKNNAIGT